MFLGGKLTKLSKSGVLTLSINNQVLELMEILLSDNLVT